MEETEGGRKEGRKEGRNEQRKEKRKEKRKVGRKEKNTGRKVGWIPPLDGPVLACGPHV